ncbi:DUF4190 domain-containing protein [Lysobacter xanthus]
MNSLPPPTAASVAPTSLLAIWSLVLGIAAWVVLPFIGSIGAIVCGHLARRDIRASRGALAGDGLAIAGLALGYVHLAVAILLVIGAILLFGGFAAALLAIGLSGAH